MKERPIIFSVTTGQPTQRGKRLPHDVEVMDL
jgi:hypothetical protein